MKTGINISLLIGFALLVPDLSLHAVDSESWPTVDQVSRHCALNRNIVVHAQGLAEWARTKSPSDLLLYLNGMALTGVKPELDLVSNDKLVYKLERDAANAGNVEVWKNLLGRPPIGGLTNVRVTIGLEGKPFPAAGTQNVKLRAVNPIGFLIYVILFLGLFFGVMLLARSTDLIRDAGPSPVGGRKTFSLARSQMAFWFMLIVAAYGFIWLATGATDTITASVLGLMGISGATGLAAAVVDQSKQTKAVAELDQLRNELASLQVEQTQQGANFPAARLQRLNDVSNEIIHDKTRCCPQRTSLCRRLCSVYSENGLETADYADYADCCYPGTEDPESRKSV